MPLAVIEEGLALVMHRPVCRGKQPKLDRADPELARSVNQLIKSGLSRAEIAKQFEVSVQSMETYVNYVARVTDIAFLENRLEGNLPAWQTSTWENVPKKVKFDYQKLEPVLITLCKEGVPVNLMPKRIAEMSPTLRASAPTLYRYFKQPDSLLAPIPSFRNVHYKRHADVLVYHAVKDKLTLLYKTSNRMKRTSPLPEKVTAQIHAKAWSAANSGEVDTSSIRLPMVHKYYVRKIDRDGPFRPSNLRLLEQKSAGAKIQEAGQ